jgi:hypothetical protein
MFTEGRAFEAVSAIAKVMLLPVDPLSRGKDILAMWHLTGFHALLFITSLIITLIRLSYPTMIKCKGR